MKGNGKTGNGPKSTRQREQAKRPFIDVFGELVDFDGPLGRFWYEMADAFLESHRAFWKGYQEFLDESQKTSPSRTADDREQQLVKSLMAGYLALLKSRREQDHALVALHEKMIKAYLDFIEDLSREMKEAKEVAEFFTAARRRGTGAETKSA